MAIFSQKLELDNNSKRQNLPHFLQKRRESFHLDQLQVSDKILLVMVELGVVGVALVKIHLQHLSQLQVVQYFKINQQALVIPVIFFQKILPVLV